MNTKEAFEQLKEYFSAFAESSCFHPLFMKELSSLLKKELKGSEKSFFKQIQYPFSCVYI